LKLSFCSMGLCALDAFFPNSSTGRTHVYGTSGAHLWVSPPGGRSAGAPALGLTLPGQGEVADENSLQKLEMMLDNFYRGERNWLASAAARAFTFTQIASDGVARAPSTSSPSDVAIVH